MSQAVGFNDTITIDQVITSAKLDLGLIDTNAYDVHLEKWINEGVWRIGSKQQFIKRPAILTIQNKRCELPYGFRRFLGLRFLSNVEITNPDGSVSTLNRCGPILYMDQSFVDECNCGWQYDNYWNNYIPTFEIVGNELRFHNPINDGTQVQLSYIGVAVNDDCMYMIHPDYEVALSAYARTKFLQAFPEVKGGFTGTLLAEAKREWTNQRARIRGLVTLNEFETDRYYIIALARAWFTRQRVH
jgi:hypothetical protein